MASVSAAVSSAVMPRTTMAISSAEATGGQVFAFSVTPGALLVSGIAVGGREAGTIGEAARWLHDRDILQVTFVGDVAVASLQRLLGILAEDSRVIRRRGGPARVWAGEH